MTLDNIYSADIFNVHILKSIKNPFFLMADTERTERCKFVIKLKDCENSDGFSKRLRNSLDSEGIVVSNWTNGGNTVSFIYDGRVNDVIRIVYKRMVADREWDLVEGNKYLRGDILINYSYLETDAQKMLGLKRHPSHHPTARRRQ